MKRDTNTSKVIYAIRYGHIDEVKKLVEANYDNIDIQDILMHAYVNDNDNMLHASTKIKWIKSYHLEKQKKRLEELVCRWVTLGWVIVKNQLEGIRYIWVNLSWVTVKKQLEKEVKLLTLIGKYLMPKFIFLVILFLKMVIKLIFLFIECMIVLSYYVSSFILQYLLNQLKIGKEEAKLGNEGVKLENEGIDEIFGSIEVKDLSEIIRIAKEERLALKKRIQRERELRNRHTY